MTGDMTSRQRVSLALSHQEPDRVPMAIGGGPYGMVDSLYFDLLRTFDLGEPVPPFRQGHSISYMDDRLLERLGSDLRYVYPGASPTSPAFPTDDPDVFLDSFGQRWQRAVPYFYVSGGLLAQARTEADLDRLARWPDPHEPRWTAGVRQRAEMLRRTTGCWITARMVASHGPFQTACDLRGTEQFLVDLAMNPNLAQALLERVTATLEGLTRAYLQACGEFIDMIELPGDDYAGNSGPVISPAMFRRFIRPCLERLVSAIRQENPRIRIMLHSDGALARLLPELAALEIDVLHPLEPLPANDLAAIKGEYGDRLAFLGGIDIAHAMPGTRQQVIDEARLRIRQLGPGGGYILAPSNHLQADVPAENVSALFEAARQYGRYPIEAR